MYRMMNMEVLRPEDYKGTETHLHVGVGYDERRSERGGERDVANGRLPCSAVERISIGSGCPVTIV
jgi:hypothetical protein